MASGEIITFIVDHIDHIITRWVGGESLRKIANSLFISPATLSHALLNNPYCHQKWEAAREMKALIMLEDAIERADNAGEKGTDALDPALIKIGIDNGIKIAGKLDSRRWGDKAELNVTGGLLVEQDLSVSPAEAYEAMIKGATK